MTVTAVAPVDNSLSATHHCVPGGKDALTPSSPEANGALRAFNGRRKQRTRVAETSARERKVS